MKKVSGVESVEVSLEKAMTDIRLAPGNTVTLTQVRNILRSSGFNAREATVTAAGHAQVKGDQLLIDLAPAHVVLTVDPGPAGSAADKARSFAEQDVEVTGVIRQGDTITIGAIARRQGGAPVADMRPESRERDRGGVRQRGAGVPDT
jgi:hypothetical protein